MTTPWMMPLRGALVLLIGALLSLGAAATSGEATNVAKDKYLRADNAAIKLESDAKRRQLRDGWLRLIGQFNEAYRREPNGPWAAPSLFRAGELATQLHSISRRPADAQLAADSFNQVVERFPTSRYGPEARKALAKLYHSGHVAAGAQRPEERRAPDLFAAREQCPETLLQSASHPLEREKWLRCIGRLQDLHQREPESQQGASALFMAGKLFGELALRSRQRSDQQRAMEILRAAVVRYPASAMREEAEKLIAGMEPPTPAAARRLPGDTAGLAPADNGRGANGGAVGRSGGDRNGSEKAATGHAAISSLRFWSNPSYTRIVVSLDGETGFQHRLLKGDPSLNKPQRLYIDFDNAIIGNDIQRSVPINDELLSDARAGQYTADTVRVVVDIKSFRTYKVFSLKNPFRVILDVWGLEGGPRGEPPSDLSATALAGSPSDPGTESAPVAGEIPFPFSGTKVGANDLARQLALGVRRIVIDAGHGGKDFGAPGHANGVHEKDVVLGIANRLGRRIRQQLGCEVILTRSDDRFIDLEERTAIANTKNADLFISIHTNAVKNPDAFGIETYFLNLATDDNAIQVAARENATSTKNISDLQTILTDLMQNAKINESSRLAGHIQSALTGHLKKGYNLIRSKGVKQAPFYVLLGAQMPAVLIETSFISNPRECDRLTSAAYQDQLCQGIVNGIRQYVNETQPTALPTIRSTDRVPRRPDGKRQ